MRRVSVFALAFLAPVTLTAQTNPLLPENSVTRVSEHVSAIVGWPNVAIVVGSRGTLVVDTGMGPRNGAVVMHEVEKLTKSPNLYLTTTHFHPEHSSGEPAFPPRTVLIRPVVQQEEMNRRMAQFMEMFSGRSPQMKQLLDGVTLRNPDILFDRELKLDLGGVTARLMWVGGGHTKGDELIFVEPDATLISGDIVENKLVPNLPNEDATVKGWLALVEQAEALHPRYVVPDHGNLGDGSLVAQEKAFLLDAQTRTLALKHEGKSADQAAAQITEEFRMKYAGWESIAAVANVVRRAWVEGR
jgi:glyoxylase-like metal-dependent hydrolase (beta-lactamase superfamily II)